MKRYITPQEKKTLSYAKDTRNTYAESGSSSRKTIAKRKALATRSLRRAQEISTVKLASTLEEADPGVQRPGKSVWRKLADSPLAEYVGRTLARRVRAGMTPSPKASSLLKATRQHQTRKLHLKGPLQD